MPLRSSIHTDFALFLGRHAGLCFLEPRVGVRSFGTEAKRITPLLEGLELKEARVAWRDRQMQSSPASSNATCPLH